MPRCIKALPHHSSLKLILVLSASLFLPSCSPAAPAVTSPDPDDVGALDAFLIQIQGRPLEASLTETERSLLRAADQISREEWIAECMSALGFHYELQPFDSGNLSEQPFTELMGTEEFASQYGFGISTIAPEYFESLFVFPVDVNQAALDNMSQTERAAWDDAYWGPYRTDTSGARFRDGGCRPQADREILGINREIPAQFELLNQAISSLPDEILSDPRLISANIMWSSCMIDSGYEGLSDSSQLFQQIQKEWQHIRFEARNHALDNWDWEALPDGPNHWNVDQRTVDEFSAREIALATADFHCREVANLDSIQLQIMHEHQSQFVEKHRLGLEEWSRFAAENR